MVASKFRQTGLVTSTAVITIGGMSSIGSLGSEALFTLTVADIFDFDGRLILSDGVPENQDVILHGPLTTGATIDLTGGDVSGILEVRGGGDILDGGAVTDTGLVHLTGGGLTARTYSGNASFTSVSTRGTIELQDSGNLAGSLTIGGTMDGKISIDGEMQTGAAISITGDVSEDITVGGSMDGAISIGGALAGSAQVVIGGLCDGPMTIGKETGALSLIRATNGLGVAGSITINDSRGNFDANGDIFLGRPGTQTPPFPVVFDGSILIKDALGVGGGDLNGKIKIFACHSTTDDMDICICGSINGLVGINQTGCPNQVGWSCVSGCP